MKARDPRQIAGGQAVAGIYRKQPQLIEVRVVEARHDGVVTVCARLPVASYHLIERAPAVIGERCQMLSKQREALDVPVVFHRRYCGL